MIYLLETPVGLALFKHNENENMLIDKIKYTTVSETAQFYDKFAEGILPDSFVQFISSNIKNTNTLNVLNPEMVNSISKQCGINVVSIADSVFRQINVDAYRYFDMSKDAYETMTLKLATKGIKNTTHADQLVIDSLNTIEELEKSTNNRIMRVREWYSLHFPELNQVQDHGKYMKYLLKIGNRNSYLSSHEKQSEEIPEEIQYQINNSMGCEITENDMDKIKENVENILRDIEYKSKQISLLKQKVSNNFPNLYSLIGESLTAKMLRKAGSITQLSQCRPSTIQIYGAEKAFMNAIKSETATPKYGFIYDSPIVSKVPEELKGKVARVLANKIALCARVDSQIEKSTDGSFGEEQREKIEEQIQKMEEVRNKQKKRVHQSNKRIISVKEYDNTKDRKDRK